MTDIEIAIGLLITRIADQARPDTDRAGTRATESVELALRAVHELVTTKLGEDPALERLRIEAGGYGEVRPRTRARLVMALEDAVEDDPEFARKLEHAVDGARTGDPAEGVARGSVVNQITGTVNGWVIQARDIHGNVTSYNDTKGD